MQCWGGNGTVPPPDEISQYFLRQASDYSTNVCGYAPRLYGTYKKGLNLFPRLSSKCELIFDSNFFAAHKKLALSVKEKRIAVT